MDGERGRSGVGGNGSGRREHTHKRRRLLQNTDTHTRPHTHTPMHQAVLGYILPVASPKTWPDISITAVHSKHIHTHTNAPGCTGLHFTSSKSENLA